ncbi:MAG: sensor histidine kinase [Actinomycetota bacterium]
MASQHNDIEWPWYVPVGAAVIPAAIAGEVAFHRRAVWPPTIEALWIVLAVAPYILDALDQAVPFRLSLPEWLFSAMVIGPTTLLLLEPVELDFVPFMLVFLAGEMGSRLRIPASALVAGAGIGVMMGLEIAGIFQGGFIWVIGILFGWCAGMVMQQQMLLTSRMKAEQASLAERSATEERQRIAREIHDVIAHSMSVTMLHITAARMALERNRPPDALEALLEAEQQGRNSLRDIRRTVGLLGPEESSTAPAMPSAADVPRLVADFRAAGLDVNLALDGDVGSLPPAAGLNVYRIVQESLTNVVKHAPGARATVDLKVDGSNIRLRVHNESGNGAVNAVRSEGGLGLKGMAGRAALLGGTLAADDDGAGWTVSLVAPRPTA